MANKEKRDELSPLEMLRIVGLTEAARLAGVHPKTLRKNHSDKIINVTKKKLGMRVRDALMIKGDE